MSVSLRVLSGSTCSSPLCGGICGLGYNTQPVGGICLGLVLKWFDNQCQDVVGNCSLSLYFVIPQKSNGATAFAGGEVYTSGTSQGEMLEAINDIITEDVDNKLRDSKFIGIIVDESTDVSVHKKLAIYARVVLKGKPQVLYLDCVNIEDGRAATIVKEVEFLCAQKGLDTARIISLSSDGASVMMGKNNGVGAIWKRAHQPRLIHVHCVAHRLALAAASACRDIPGFDEYQRTLKQVYHFFANSPVRYNSLRELQDVWGHGTEDSQFKKLALKEPAPFRWLSLHAAVKAIHGNYPAVVAALEHEAAKNNGRTAGCAEAKGLSTKTKSVHFVLTTAFLLDILLPLTKLSKMFQAEHVDFGVIDPLVKSTITVLDMHKTVNGIHLDRAYNDIVDGIYRGVKIADRQQMRIKFQNESTRYLTELVGNLEARFDNTSMETLRALDVVLNPANSPATSAALIAHGVDEIDTICDVFGKVINTSPVPVDGVEVRETPAIIDSDTLRGDFMQFKVFLKSSNFSSLSDACEKVSGMVDTFPDFAILAQLVMSCPVTSVACERGFSVQNRLATKFRSRLLSDKVSKLMSVVQGPSQEDFDYQRAVARFNSIRKRIK